MNSQQQTCHGCGTLGPQKKGVCNVCAIDLTCDEELVAAMAAPIWVPRLPPHLIGEDHAKFLKPVPSSALYFASDCPNGAALLSRANYNVRDQRIHIALRAPVVTNGSSSWAVHNCLPQPFIVLDIDTKQMEVVAAETTRQLEIGDFPRAEMCCSQWSAGDCDCSPLRGGEPDLPPTSPTTPNEHEDSKEKPDDVYP